MDDLPEYVRQFFNEHMTRGAEPDFEVPPRVFRYLTRIYKRLGIATEVASHECATSHGRER